MNFNYLFALILLFILRINVLYAHGCKSPLVNLKYVTYKNDSHVNRTIFSHFNSFDQLNVKCSQYDVTNFLVFIPRQRLVLDDGFSPRDFLTLQQVSSIKCVQLLNLKGFNIHQKVTIKRNDLNKGINLIIFSSELKLYSNASPNRELTKCDTVTYNYSDNFMNSFDLLKLDNTKYPRVVCPYVFRKSRIKTLMFGDVSNSFLLKNRLFFHDSNSSIMTMLRSIYLEIKYDTLDSHNLDKHLFHYLSELSVNGVLTRIETNLFENFFYLKNINFQLENYKTFFHASNNKWMSSMNSRVNINLSSANDLDGEFIVQKMLLLSFTSLNKMSSFDGVYEYPNEDLCLFQYFPHGHAVFPLFITSGEKLNCTCTIYWLNYYSHVYRGNFLIESNTTRLICDDVFNLSHCDIDNRLKKCDVTPVLDRESFFKSINDTDILFLIKWLQFILLTILQPLLCGLGIINNLINLIVIKNKSKKKEFNETMYRFIEINSIFNIFYCLCMSMKLINTCIFDVGSVFCSSVYKTDSSQYFKIVFIFFLGNAFKLSSNISYLLF